jgi:hypothetical protein
VAELQRVLLERSRRTDGDAPLDPASFSFRRALPHSFPLFLLQRRTGKGKNPNAALACERGSVLGVVGFGQGDKGMDTVRALVGWRGGSSDVAARPWVASLL